MTTHKDEIVERLRDYGVREKPLRDEAADLIEQQASTIERMEGALRRILALEFDDEMDAEETWVAMLDIARAALTNKEK